MLKDILENLSNNDTIRTSLIQLKEEIKQELSDKKQQKDLLSFFQGKYDTFFLLLSHDDPKVRKNTAQILGLLADSSCLKPLWEAYQREETRFVRSSYLIAIRQLEYSEIMEEILKRKETLLLEPVTQENKKHLAQELRLLEDLLLAGQTPKIHSFTGWNIFSELFLVTEKDHAVQTIQELKEQKITGEEWNFGVLVKTEKIREVASSRTFRELLFFVPGMKTLPGKEKAAAEKIAKSTLLDFLKERHEGITPFYFRLEIRGKQNQEQKSKFAKRLSMEIEYQTNRKLLNSTSHYEVELRMIENKEGSYTTFVKLMTMPDLRFSYRSATVAASIRPNVAALIMRLCADYLKSDAMVLDPFCGVGTMLIERRKWGKTGSMYGIDTFLEAVLGARENTKAAKMTIYYIHRNFFSFQHDFMFDELITNLPFTKKKEEEQEIQRLYEKFFQKALQHMKNQGILVLYTHNVEWIKINLKNNYKIEKMVEISKREGTYLCILRVLAQR